MRRRKRRKRRGERGALYEPFRPLPSPAEL